MDHTGGDVCTHDVVDVIIHDGPHHPNVYELEAMLNAAADQVDVLEADAHRYRVGFLRALALLALTSIWMENRGMTVSAESLNRQARRIETDTEAEGQEREE